MKTKKHIIQITIILSIVSLTMFTVLQFHKYPDCLRKSMTELLHDVKQLREYLIIIFSGIFTGALTTLFITFREYQDEREKTLTDYYLISRDFLKNFYGIEYLKFVHPMELVIGCIFEDAENKNKLYENEGLRKVIYKEGKNKKTKKIYKESCKTLSYVEKNKMKQYIWDHLDNETRIKCNECDGKEAYLDSEYDRIMRVYYTTINRVMEQYVKLSNLSYRDVETAYAHIDFLVQNNSIRKYFIYEKIHNRQRDMLNLIKEKSDDFKEYENHKNLPAMIKVINVIQDKIFIKEEGELGYSVYNNYYLDIDTRLYELLKVVYGKNYKGDKPNKSEVYVCSVIVPEKIRSWEEVHNEY